MHTYICRRRDGCCDSSPQEFLALLQCSVYLSKYCWSSPPLAGETCLSCFSNNPKTLVHTINLSCLGFFSFNSELWAVCQLKPPESSPPFYYIYILLTNTISKKIICSVFTMDIFIQFSCCSSYSS